MAVRAARCPATGPGGTVGLSPVRANRAGEGGTDGPRRHHVRGQRRARRPLRRHLGRRPRRRQHRRTTGRTSSRSWLDEFDAWAAAYEMPFEDLRGDLGARNWDSARRLPRPRGRRPGRRGHLSRTRCRRSSRSRRSRRSRRRSPPPTPSGAGPASRPTTAGSSTSAPTRPGRRAGDRADHPARHRGVGRRDPLGAGRRAHRRRAAARHAARARAAPALRARTTSRCGRCARSSACRVNHHTGSAAPPMGPEPDGRGRVPARGLVVVAPGAHPPHRRRRVRAPPRAAARVHRAGHRVGARRAVQARLLLGPHGQRRSARRSTCGAAGRVERCRCKPSEYWARQCHVGASFIRPAEVGLRHPVGVDRIMWGSDYPHKEASTPYSRRGHPARVRRRAPRRGRGHGRRQRRRALRLRPRRARARSPQQHRPARRRRRRAPRAGRRCPSRPTSAPPSWATSTPPTERRPNH